jgi:hypothetical protein
MEIIMTRKFFFTLAIVAALVAIPSLPTLAQDTQSKPVVSARENVLVPGTEPVLKQPWQDSKTAPPVPSYCNGNGGGCLFYGGDSNSANKFDNALSNETDIVVSGSPYGAAVYANFEVPATQSWSVTGLFSNVLSTVDRISPNQVYWEIRSGVSAGNGGTLVASGTGSGSFIATGRTGLGLTEYTTKVYLTPSVPLVAGTYFMTVIPACTTSNSTCPSARYFLSDVEDVPPPNKRGFQQGNLAFLNSAFAGANYEPTWGATGACAGLGCNRFSIGVIGTP